MAGPPFPEPASFSREQSYGDHGTPYSNAGDIPIDPALSAPPVDPVLLAEGRASVSLEPIPPPTAFLPFHLPPPGQYPQGPQGDPFAPQPPPLYLPVKEPTPPPTRPSKKKRAPRREEECGVCQGNDYRNNKTGEQELMVSCAECGRSAHPTCLQLREIGHIMLSYDWNCADCKKCEVCKQKGRPNRMIFCDFCDRGWHMDCLQPPIENAPPGKWHCPRCPPLPPQELQAAEMEQASHVQFDPSFSLASSSRLQEEPVHDEVDPTTGESDIDIGGEATPRVSARKGKKKLKGKVGNIDDQEVPPSSTRTIKRMRLRLSSPAPSPPFKTLPTIRLRLPAQPPRSKGKAREDEAEEAKHGLFDDILTPEDRDTSSTAILNADRQRFEKSRVAAEEKLLPPPPNPDAPDTPIAGPSTRPLRSAVQYHSTPIAPEPSQSPVPSTPGGLPRLPPGQRIQRIRFGEYDIETWYDAPFPEEYAHIPDGRLWICEFCLRYMKSSFAAYRHKMKCKMRHPPGDEIYRDGFISIFEVDGRKNKIYCQNLCLLSKMFLDHKSLFYDVEPFLFYVITELDDSGARFVGYFSKEKRSPKDYNVSCIMTLPVRQRQGWGNLLIDFSYLLSKKEQRTGSPEKPLSALGALGYKNYWTLSIMRYLQTAPPNPRLEDISHATAMTIEDIHSTLVQLNMITVSDAMAPPRPLPGQSIKFPKGRKNGLARRHLQRTQTQDDEKMKGPFVPPTHYEIRWDPKEVQEYLARWEAKKHLKLQPEKLKWSPFISARTRKSEQLVPEAVGASEDSQPKSSSASGGEKSSTPGPGSTLETDTAAQSSLPPVSALFDDDNVVEVVAPVTSDKAATNDSEVSLTHSSSTGSSYDADQLEKDRILAERLATLPERRLRSRGLSIDTSTPGTFPDERPILPERRKSSRHTIPTSPMAFKFTPTRTNGRSVAGSVMGDATPTPRPALEDGRERRQLHSRSNTSQVTKRAFSPPASRSVSPRKRRRVDSSPEVDATAPPQLSPVRRSLRRATENHDLPAGATLITEPRHERKSARLANGARVSSPSSPDSPMAPPASNDHVQSPHGEHGRSMNGRHLYVVDEERDDSSRAEHGAVNSPADEMKYEDTDTPATLMNSRHSAPSDDTVFGAEAEDLGDVLRKDSPVGQDVEMAHEDGHGHGSVAMTENDNDPVREEHEQPPALAPISTPSASAVDVGDEDAEGEDDIDAEGEPDDGEEQAMFAFVPVETMESRLQDGQSFAV